MKSPCCAAAKSVKGWRWMDGQRRFDVADSEETGQMVGFKVVVRTELQSRHVGGAQQVK